MLYCASIPYIVIHLVCNQEGGTIMKKQMQYICDYCHARYDEEKYCISCEKNCKSKLSKLKDINLKLKEVFIDHYIYEAESLEDLDECLRLKFSGYNDSYNYEDYKYPCKVVIFEYLEPEPSEHYYDTYVHIENLDDFIEKLNQSM